MTAMVNMLYPSLVFYHLTVLFNRRTCSYPLEESRFSFWAIIEHHRTATIASQCCDSLEERDLYNGHVEGCANLQ